MGTKDYQAKRHLHLPTYSKIVKKYNLIKQYAHAASNISNDKSKIEFIKCFFEFQFKRIQRANFWFTRIVTKLITKDRNVSKRKFFWADGPGHHNKDHCANIRKPEQLPTLLLKTFLVQIYLRTRVLRHRNFILPMQLKIEL